MKKILIKNRRLIRILTPCMFLAGVCLLIILGITIISESPANIDLSNKPSWLGYLLFYGGFIVFLSFLLEVVRQQVWNFRQLFKQKSLRQLSLKERIKEAEKG